jgi:hypothetical protein
MRGLVQTLGAAWPRTRSAHTHQSLDAGRQRLFLGPAASVFTARRPRGRDPWRRSVSPSSMRARRRSVRPVTPIPRWRGLYSGLQPHRREAHFPAQRWRRQRRLFGRHAALPLFFMASHPAPRADCLRAIQAPFLADAPPLAPPAGAATGQKMARERRKTRLRDSPRHLRQQPVEKTPNMRGTLCHNRKDDLCWA